MKKKRDRYESKNNEGRANKLPPIYIVSGGSGASGKQIVETVLAQFPGIHVPTIKISYVRQREQIEEAVSKALTTGGTIVHTLVDNDLRKTLIRLGKKKEVTTIDLMGPLLGRLAEVLGQEPLGQPGLYRQLHKDYFDRIAAIEFTVAHDDGQRPQELPSADIVLLGVSRCGKTPLSMYLAVQCWKVANIPIVFELPLPQELYEVDRNRVIGLDIEYEHLMNHRKKRQMSMGMIGPSSYAEPSAVYKELEFSQRIYKKGGFAVVNVTNKPIETIADEIIKLITDRRLP
jgi:regulator of PEP synthase PpsR (kinase-PPPase family)